jgi:hypothetical protein
MLLGLPLIYVLFAYSNNVWADGVEGLVVGLGLRFTCSPNWCSSASKVREKA